MSLYEKIYKVVKRIPPGNVSSYGRIARVVSCNARQVGYAMAATPNNQDIPWHRVVNSKGEISRRKDGNSDERQRALLIEEGILFDEKGRISFEHFECKNLAESSLPEDWPEDWPDPTAWEREHPGSDRKSE